MKPGAYRIALALVLVTALAVGAGWWRLRANRVRIERDLATFAAENQNRRAWVVRREEAAQAIFAERKNTHSTPRQTWQEQIRKLSEALKSQRLANPVLRPLPPPSGPGGDLFKELMNDPEYARLAMTIWRTGWEAQWLRAFRWAGIPSNKLEKLHSLIVEQGQVRDDAELVGRKFGLGAPAIFELQGQLMAAAEADSRALLGAEAYDRLRQVRHATGANDLLGRFETRLSYSATALEPEQGAQLFALLVQAKVGFMLEPGQLAPVVDRARAFLRADQLEVLQQVADEFNAGKKIVRGP